MKRILLGIGLAVFAVLMAWFLVRSGHGGRNHASSETPSAAASPVHGESGTNSSPRSRPPLETGHSPNADRPDPGPLEMPMSNRILRMEPAQIVDLAEERKGLLMGCTNAIDECFQESLDALRKRGGHVPSLDAAETEKLKRYFEQKVNDAIEYFEFVGRHASRLDENQIDRNEFYYRVSRRSGLFESEPADILDRSIPEYNPPQDAIKIQPKDFMDGILKPTFKSSTR